MLQTTKTKRPNQAIGLVPLLTTDVSGTGKGLADVVGSIAGGVLSTNALTGADMLWGIGAPGISNDTSGIAKKPRGSEISRAMHA